jgi:hypothetical protein
MYLLLKEPTEQMSRGITCVRVIRVILVFKIAATSFENGKDDCM